MQNRKSNAYLVQIGQTAYTKWIASHTYSGLRTKDRRAEQLQSFIRAGDTLVIYCLGSVAGASNQIIAVQNVRAVSPDHAQIKLEGRNHLLSPVPLTEIRRWVLEGRLDPAFQHCGDSNFPISRISQTSVRWLVNPEEIDTHEDEERVLNIYRSEMGNIRRFLFEQPRPPTTPEQIAEWISFCVKFGNYVEAIMLWMVMDKDTLEEHDHDQYARLERLIDLAHERMDEES